MEILAISSIIFCIFGGEVGLSEGLFRVLPVMIYIYIGEQTSKHRIKIKTLLDKFNALMEILKNSPTIFCVFGGEVGLSEGLFRILPEKFCTHVGEKTLKYYSKIKNLPNKSCTLKEALKISPTIF